MTLFVKVILNTQWLLAVIDMLAFNPEMCVLCVLWIFVIQLMNVD